MGGPLLNKRYIISPSNVKEMKFLGFRRYKGVGTRELWELKMKDGQVKRVKLKRNVLKRKFENGCDIEIGRKCDIKKCILQ